MSVLAALVWGAAGWSAVALPLAAVLIVLLAWGYRRAGATPGVRTLAAAVKLLGILILALCLLEPLLTSNRARPGANLFVVLTDNSQSMTLRDRDAVQTRADQVKSLLPAQSKWLMNLRQVFDLRQYAFDTQLKTFAGAEELTFDGGASNLGASLERIVKRYQGRPIAGILLMTDGSTTDAAAVSTSARALSVLANKGLDPDGLGAQAMIGWQVGDRTIFACPGILSVGLQRFTRRSASLGMIASRVSCRFLVVDHIHREHINRPSCLFARH